MRGESRQTLLYWWETSQKSLSRGRADIEHEPCGPSLSCELRPEETSQQRRFGLGSRTGNSMSRGKWTKKIHTRPLITLLHGLKLHAVQCLAWCPLMGKGKQNASRDTLLNTWSIKKSASFINFWHLYYIITLVCCYWFGFRSKLYCFLTDFLLKDP